MFEDAWRRLFSCPTHVQLPCGSFRLFSQSSVFVKPSAHCLMPLLSALHTYVPVHQHNNMMVLGSGCSRQSQH